MLYVFKGNHRSNGYHCNKGSRSKVSIKGQSRVTKMRFGNGLLGPKNNSPIGPSENNPITKD